MNRSNTGSTARFRLWKKQTPARRPGMPPSRPDRPSVCSYAGPATSDGGGSRRRSRSGPLPPRRGRARLRVPRSQPVYPRRHSTAALRGVGRAAAGRVAPPRGETCNRRRRGPQRGQRRALARRHCSAGELRAVPLLPPASRQRRRRLLLQRPRTKAWVTRTRSAIGAARQLRPGDDSIRPAMAMPT